MVHDTAHSGRQARAIPALVDKLQLALQGTIPTPLYPCPIINYLFVGISFVTLTLSLCSMLIHGPFAVHGGFSFTFSCEQRRYPKSAFLMHQPPRRFSNGWAVGGGEEGGGPVSIQKESELKSLTNRKKVALFSASVFLSIVSVPAGAAAFSCPKA